MLTISRKQTTRTDLMVPSNQLSVLGSGTLGGQVGKKSSPPRSRRCQDQRLFLWATSKSPGVRLPRERKILGRAGSVFHDSMSGNQASVTPITPYCAPGPFSRKNIKLQTPPRLAQFFCHRDTPLKYMWALRGFCIKFSITFPIKSCFSLLDVETNLTYPPKTGPPRMRVSSNSGKEKLQ